MVSIKTFSIATVAVLLAFIPAINGNVALYNSVVANCGDFMQTNGLTDNDALYNTFVANLAVINALNSNDGNTWTAAPNCWALTTDEEFTATLGISNPPGPGINGVSPPNKPGNQPDEYDHIEQGTMTGARSQGSCGSCYAFSAMGALESAYLVRSGDNPDDVDFSEQQLLDCTYESDSARDGCGGGWMTQVWDRLYNNEDNHLASESSYPYTGTDGACNADDHDNAMTKIQLTSTKYSYLGDQDSGSPIAEGAATFLYTNWVLSVAMQAEDAFSYYDSGVFNTQCDSTSINHAVTLYGYTEDTFLGQNSWGTWWGINGNFVLSRNDGNVCQFFSYMMYPDVECRYGEDSNGYCIDGDDDDDDDDDDDTCTKKCKNGKECYWKNEGTDNEKMSCKCPDGRYGKGCDMGPDCTVDDKKRCSKIQEKKPDKFEAKCAKAWGPKKCPAACGYCHTP